VATAPQPVPPLAGLLGDGVGDAASSQVAAETAEAADLVRDDLAGSAAWPAEAAAGNADTFEQDACAGAAMALARRDEDGRGTVLAVTGEVDFG
jgi:hypothetical protein